MEFDILEEVYEYLNNFHHIEVHLLFSVNMDLSRKARLVIYGQKDPGIYGISYAFEEHIKTSIFFALDKST